MAEDVTDTTIVLKDSTGAVTGMAETDSNGVANDLLFTTQTVDSSVLTTKQPERLRSGGIRNHRLLLDQQQQQRC